MSQIDEQSSTSPESLSDPSAAFEPLTEGSEARAVLTDFLPTDQVVRKRVFSSLLRGLTRGTN